MGKRKNSSGKPRGFHHRNAQNLLKFKKGGTSVKVSPLYGNRTMMSKDLKKVLNIRYKMKNHALLRLNERALYENDIRQTLLHGVAFKSSHENSNVYVYEHRCFRVVVDREITDHTADVIVISAMYTNKFTNLALRLEKSLFPSGWLMLRELRHVYDALSNNIYEPRMLDEVKRILISRGFSYHNAYTLRLNRMKSKNDLGLNRGNYIPEIYYDHRKYATAYAANETDIRSGDYEGLCNALGNNTYHFNVDKRNYLVEGSRLASWGVSKEELESFLDDISYDTLLRDGCYAVLVGYNYRIVLVYCKNVTFVYDVEIPKEYKEVQDKLRGLCLEKGKVRSALFDEMAVARYGIYADDFVDRMRKKYEITINRSNLKSFNKGLKNQRNTLETLRLEIG